MMKSFLSKSVLFAVILSSFSYLHADYSDAAKREDAIQEAKRQDWQRDDAIQEAKRQAWKDQQRRDDDARQRARDDAARRDYYRR